MKVGYLQPVGGISGDMFLSALVSSGLSVDDLNSFFESLPGRIRAEVSVDTVNGLKVIKTILSYEKGEGLPRTFQGVLGLIDGLGVEEELKQKAKEVFRVLFEAEARVHGCSLAEVRLHELSSYDTLGDVLGVLYGLKKLGIEELFCAPLPLGRGLLNGSHGPMPLPAPATLEILKGIPVYGIDEQAETVTPTGAALLRVLVKEFGEVPPMTLQSVGTGAGQNTFKSRPNLLRLYIGVSTEALVNEEVFELVCDVDDETPEVLACVVERLFLNGALDVGLVPRVMKKGRMGTRLEVLCRPEKGPELTSLLLEETSTLGVRIRRCVRTKLTRKTFELNTPYGIIRIKEALAPSGKKKFKPEIEDLKRVAFKEGLSIREVKEKIIKLMDKINSEGA